MALISNDSLTPTRLDPNTVFTPSNYPDNRSVIGAFRRAVQMCLEDPEERTALFTALKKFQASMIVEELMDDLSGLLDHPDKRILYKYISPLVPSRSRGEYKSLVPHIPSFEKKIVRLKQQGSHPYGFSIRGGKEFGCGIFVTNVLKSSKSAQAGLMPGDQIIRVNGLIISESTHDEFVNLIKWKHSLTLTIKVIGLIPELKHGQSKVTWKSVGETRGWQSSTRIGVHGPIQSTKRIQVTLKGNESLGASIKTSSVVDAGVLIVDIVPNSPADNAGLRRGDEIVEVNGKELIGKTLDEASRILRSSNSLMMTIRVEEQSPKRYMYRRNSLESVPTSDFEIGRHDFDIDAETLRHGQDEETGFVLRTRVDPTKTRNAFKKTPSGARISVIDAEIEQSRLPPTLASPAAFGHGPALAMPTILGIPPQGDSSFMEESTDFGNFHHSLVGEPTSPKRSSIEMSPVSPPTPIPLIGRATVEGCEDGQQSLKVVRDLSSQFQFPVDEEESAQEQSKKLSGQPSGSALKKGKGNGGSKLTKKPTFSDNIQIIPQKAGSVSSRTSHDSLIGSSVHPSNLSFSPEILQGRQVQFHTIPKDGPLRLAIRGGVDTPLGPQIIISRIIEGGAAARYGKLNVGDQVLVCDGVSLIDVTHDEAGQAFKRAMDLESSSIDLVVAVNPEANTLANTQCGGTDTNI